MIAPKVCQSQCVPIGKSGGSQVSVNRVLQILAELTGNEPQVVRKAPMPGDVRHTSADLARAREVLGYRPQVGIEEGLCREVEWLRQERPS